MKAMSHIPSNTPRTLATPPVGPSSSRKIAVKEEAKSPRVREQSGNSTGKLFPPLFSSPSRQPACIPPVSPRRTHAAAGSPYKPPSSGAGQPGPDPSASLRAYLEGLKPDNLANAIFRDQTAATALTYPTAWISQLQASLEAPLGKLCELAPAVLAAMPENLPARLYPGAGCEQDFDWQPFGRLCGKLWPEFSSRVISLESLPPRTLGMLAELHQELAGLEAFRKLQPEARNKVLSDALFNLLIWNGIFSPLTKIYPDQYLRLVNGFCSYVKAAWGMQAQTQGSIGQAIISLVPAGHVKQCADFSAALLKEVERLASLRTVQFQDRLHEPKLSRLLEKNMDVYFTDTWLGRADDYKQVVKKGNYYLTDADGVEYRCTSYEDFCKYVGNGSKNSLPHVVLHVAGERIKNFLCNTYLYHCDTPLFTDAKGQRVEPVPELSTKFIMSCNENGRVTVGFSCADMAVKSAMLVESDDDGFSAEAAPLFRASLKFDGEFHFYPHGEEFEAGNIHVIGQNLHMFDY